MSMDKKYIHSNVAMDKSTTEAIDRFVRQLQVELGTKVSRSQAIAIAMKRVAWPELASKQGLTGC